MQHILYSRDYSPHVKQLEPRDGPQSNVFLNNSTNQSLLPYSIPKFYL